MWIVIIIAAAIRMPGMIPDIRMRPTDTLAMKA
jgi:hypothetical protein